MRNKIRQAAVLVIVIALFLILKSLPVETGVERLTHWVDGKGVIGPIVLGLFYIVAALLFLPGSVLTGASGAVFGLVVGTITVSIASTTAAALAFLIARYLARDKVAAKAQASPKFAAIDKAIGDGGWRIIALLRLSPLVPFSLGNYLFGLTPIRFWPYALTSWIAMLPGTFMYVYFGHIAKVAVAGGGSAGASKTAMTVVGLAATVAVTIYVSRLAGKALREQTTIGAEPPAAAAEEPRSDPSPASAA